MIITTEQTNQNTTKHQIKIDGEKISFSDWIQAMLSSDELVMLFNQTLKESSFDAFFWEVKPVNNKRLNHEFEFVIVQSSSLERIVANDQSFKKYFNSNESIVNFPNLRGDAELIVPVPTSSDTEYAHIAKFVRTAGVKQVVEFWRRVIEVYSQNLGEETKWLSTSGLGVHWLHARVDSWPKYYQHLAYKL